MTIKATKFRSAAEARDHTKRGGGGGGLQSVPKEGCTVRFLTEPEEWIAYSEMYDADNQAYLPLADEDDVPSGARISTRYVANVLWQSDGVMQGKVVSFKMPKKVAIALLNKYDKYGTMTDRDYEVARYGEGTNTEYDVTPESPSKVNIKKYELLDLIEKLTEERERALGRIEGNADDSKAKGKSKAKDTAAPAKGKATKAAPKRGDDDEEDDDAIDFNSLGEGADDGDEECMEALTEAAEAADLDPNDFPTWVELAEALTAAAEGDDEDEEADEEEDAEEEDEEEDEGIDPAALKALAKKADKDDEDAQESLTEYAEQVDLDPDDFETWKELVEAIIEAASGDEDEEEEDEEGDDEEVEIDLDTLNGMSLGELRKLADDFEIEHKGLTKKALIQAIVDSAEE